MSNFKIGDQICFDPGHESGKEYGFVARANSEIVFCRFWSKTNLGSLRTLANSEGCDPRQLSKTGENVPKEIIDAWLQYLGYNNEAKPQNG